MLYFLLRHLLQLDAEIDEHDKTDTTCQRIDGAAHG